MTDAEKRRNDRDAEMLAQVGPTWRIKTSIINPQEWLIVLNKPDEHGVLKAWSGCLVDVWIGVIIAIHPPSDDPQMATAYQIAEPSMVTRAEAEKMVQSQGPNWHWYHPHEDRWMIAWAGDYIEYASAIRSPGGNVIEIRDEDNGE